MKNLLDFLNNFGIPVDESTPTFLLLCGYYLIVSVFILLNVVNICIYLASIYIVSNEKLLNKIPSTYTYVHNSYVIIRISELFILYLKLFY